MRNLILAIVAGAVVTFATSSVQAQRYGYGGGKGRAYYSSSYRGGGRSFFQWAQFFELWIFRSILRKFVFKRVFTVQLVLSRQWTGFRW